MKEDFILKDRGWEVVKKFPLSRKNIADLLLALKSQNDKQANAILQDAWAQSTHTVIESEFPPIFNKILKNKKEEIGFSMNEIVSLGNFIEFTNLTSTAVQNWVKRDVKELIGSPQLGKKYTVDQAAILLIVEDLRASLDFESIRKILKFVFNDPIDRTDDVIDPLDFYSAYASIFEKLHHDLKIKENIENANFEDPSINGHIEHFIQEEVKQVLETFRGLTVEQTGVIENVIIMAVLSLQSAFYQAVTKRYLNKTLLLHEK